MTQPRIFTIGHSTRSIDEFIEVIEAHEIQQIVDIRSIPMSRHNPQFNAVALQPSLHQRHIAYLPIKALGGLRHPRQDSINLGWTNASFRGYADYMASQEFRDGLQQLMEVAANYRTAILCAEAVPWRCHRSLVADALIQKGWLVEDIMSRTRAVVHRLTPFLKVCDGQLTYPRAEVLKS